LFIIAFAGPFRGTGFLMPTLANSPEMP
jgi:hypothetical protein